MINPFQTGDTKEFTRTVAQSDIAAFDTGTVHPVYATFALGRDAEWACRLFVLEMKEADEEGIGTFLTVNHHAPAVLGETVKFNAQIESVIGHEIICSFRATVKERLIATGQTGQKILKKEKINRLFDQLNL